jgi:hypothetical protein
MKIRARRLISCTIMILVVSGTASARDLSEILQEKGILMPNEHFESAKASGRTVTPRQTELLGAVNYYFAGHNLKLMTDFGPIGSEAVQSASGAYQDRDDSRWRLQAQMYF